MNKFLLGAVGAALLVVLALAGTSYTGVDVAYAQGNVDFDVDPDITGNTNAVLGNGWPVERCTRCDVAPGDINDGLADCLVDVVVHGDTAAPYGYDAKVSYDDTLVNVVQWGFGTTLTAACGPGGFVACSVADSSGFAPGALIQFGPPGTEITTVISKTPTSVTVLALASAHATSDPVYGGQGTDTLIKMAGGLDASDSLPDTVSPFVAGVGYPSGGPGTAGDGTLVRIGLDVISSPGVVDFSFAAPPGTAYAGANPSPPPDYLSHPVTLYTGQLAINTDCPLPVIDIGVDSVITDEPLDDGRGNSLKGDVDVSVNDTITVDTTATNYGPETASQNVLIEADITPPAGCEIVGLSHDETTVALQFGGTATHTLSSTFTIHCSEASDHDFTIDNAASYTDPNYQDPEPVANSDQEVVELEAWASADVKIEDMFIVDPPAGIPLNTPTDIIVRKELHNNGPYAPNVAVDMAMSASATPVYPGSEALIGACNNFFDDDMDGAVNDGCPIVGAFLDCDDTGDGDCADMMLPPFNMLPELTLCANPRDDDAAKEGAADGAVNDGCPAVTAAANITGPSADQVVVENSVSTFEDETFTVTCTSLGLMQIDVDNDLSLKDGHIIDPSPASDSASAMILCVPEFLPAYHFYIDNDDGLNSYPPFDGPFANKVCIMGMPCEHETRVNIPGACGDEIDDDADTVVNDGCPVAGATAETGAECANAINDDLGDDPAINDGCPAVGGSEFNLTSPAPPLALVQNITPLAYNIATSAAITNGATVGWVDFGIRVDLAGLTPACVNDMGGVATMTDAAMPGEGYDWTGAALFPGVGNTAWAGQLDAVVNFVAATYSPVPMPLHARYVGTTGAPLNIPINILVFDGSLLPGPAYGTPPPGYLSLGVTANPDADLDGVWDETSDVDDDTGPCDDGMDNDHDGDIDLADSDCSVATDLEGDALCDEGTPASMQITCSGWDTDDDGNGVLNPNENHLCTPYHSYTWMLGETQGVGAPETLRTCTVFGPNAGIALLTRGDIGTTTTLMDVVNCITADTDLVVELVKDENIVVGEDLESTETITVHLENGVGPTTVAVELVQVSTDRNICVSHLVPEGSDVLHEFTVGDQYYSKLSWVEPLMAGSEVRDVTRDYTIVCSEAGSFPNIEQFVVNVEPLDMAELDPLSNTDENHVSVDSDPDIDGDTIPNDQDNCPYNPDPDQTDTDGDGQGDICDDDDDDDGIDDGLDDCSLVPEDMDGVDDDDGCPDTDVSIDVDKNEEPDVDVSEETPYPVTVTVNNGNYAADVDVDILLVSPNGGSEDAILDEGCVVSWGDAQAGLSFVEEIICEEGGGDPDICGDDPADRFYLQSQLSGTLSIAADDDEELNLIAYIHCFEKCLHGDDIVGNNIGAFELAAGAAPLPPVREEAPADNIFKNWPDVTAWVYADLKKVSFDVIEPPAGSDIDVSDDVPVLVRSVVHNNGPYEPVDLQDEVIVTAPADCTVDSGGGPAGSASVTTVVNAVPESVDVVIDSDFEIHCSEPSTHEFTITNEVTLLDSPANEHVADPVLANNTAATSLSVNAWAYADVKIVDAYFDAPPAEIDVSDSVPVTLVKVINNPSAAPLTVTMTKTATAPADCTIDPTDVVEQVVLAPGDNVVPEEFTISCSEPSTHIFEVYNDVSGPKEPHVADPSLPNEALTQLTVAAIREVRKDVVGIGVDGSAPVTSWAQVNPIPPDPACPDALPLSLPGWPGPIAPKLVPPGNSIIYADDLDCSSDQVEISKYTTIEVLAGGCLVGPVGNPIFVFDDQTLQETEPPGWSFEPTEVQWGLSVSQWDVCQIELTVEKDTKDPHDRWSLDSQTSGSVVFDVCADSDNSTAEPDGGDPPCPGPCPDGWPDAAGCGLPADNCKYVYNPDQLDTDGDGIGDACDDTPYHDDTVKSLMVFGPAPINITDTMGRYMWIIGEIGNLTSHDDTVELNLTITPPVPAGCDEDIQQILPGRDQFILMAKEQKWVLFRVRYECHSPALPGIYPLDVELCIDHIPDAPDGDDTFPDNDCQERTKSLLLE